MSADLAFQKVLYAQLTAAMPAVPVETHPPHDQALPFIYIGETDTEDHEAGKVIMADIDVFSTAEGPHETKTIQQTIYAVLHSTTWTQDGYVFSCCRETDSRVFRNVDREHWHGTQTFRVLASTS